ncbi:MAG TPA: STAS domain-containing protein [bacterium]|nr:STAS domain-containing protein [bacterium]
MTLNRQRRRLGLPRFRVDLQERPIRTFTEGPGGLPRLVLRPAVAGGATEPGVACAVKYLDGAACLAVSGELDLAGVATFLGYLRRANDAHDNVIVDLSGLLYMDSAGINALLDAQRRFTQTGGRIVLAAPSPRIRRILRIVTLDAVIPIFPTVDDAVQYFHSDGLGEKVGS